MRTVSQKSSNDNGGSTGDGRQDVGLSSNGSTIDTKRSEVAKEDKSGSSNPPSLFAEYDSD